MLAICKKAIVICDVLDGPVPSPAKLLIKLVKMSFEFKMCGIA